MRAAEENRLSSGVSTAAVRRSLEEHIAYLREEIKQTERLIQKHINHHPDLKEQSDPLDSIPGIGETTAALLLAEIVNIKQYKSARPCCRLRRTRPARAAFGNLSARTHAPLENRQCATSQGTLVSGNHGSAMQRLFQKLG
jgi:transposase